MESRQRSVLGLVFLTVFLDMVGFSILFPLFPSLLEHYLGHEGEASAIGRLVATLARLVGGEGERAHFAVTTLFGGVLGSLYSALQFIAAPFWGALSDRIGRRPTLLVTLFFTSAAHVLWCFADTFALLVVARALGGIMAGNISTASAAIADTCAGKERVRGMGVLGAGIGLGFVVGPAIGAAAVHLDLTASWPELVRFGLHPFSGAALVALVLAVVNFAWAALRFPETLPRERRGSTAETRTLRPFRALRSIDRPGIRPAIMAYFVYTAAFSAMEFTLTFLTHERFNYTVGDQAWMFVFIGVTIALVQGGLVRRLTPRLGERAVGLTGVILTIPGLVLVGLATGAGLLYGGLFALALGSACVVPCFSSLVSRYAPSERQGLAMGVFRSMAALARTTGPLAGGLLFWVIGAQALYLLGALTLLIPVWLARGLPAPEGAT